LALLSQLTQIPVALFLREFKELVQDNGLYVINRQENQQALADLGLTRQQREEIILSLTVEDYCSGPEPDRDQPGEIWVFGKPEAGQELYIKLKIAVAGYQKIAKCISFHTANYILCYPHRIR
jgi:hypothetical protein